MTFLLTYINYLFLKSTEDINMMLHMKTRLIYITYAWVNETDRADAHIAQHTTAYRHCNINHKACVSYRLCRDNRLWGVLLDNDLTEGNFVISLTFAADRASAETTPSLYYQSLIDFTLAVTFIESPCVLGPSVA